MLLTTVGLLTVGVEGAPTVGALSLFIKVGVGALPPTVLTADLLAPDAEDVVEEVDGCPILVGLGVGVLVLTP